MVKKKLRRSPKKSGGEKAEAASASNSIKNVAEVVSSAVSQGKSPSAESSVSDDGLKTRCPHISSCQNLTANDLKRAKQKERCDICREVDRRLWFCLSDSCGQAICGSKAKNHSDEHFKRNPEHSLQLNMRSGRIWCLICNCEVLLRHNVPVFSSSALAAFSKKCISKNETKNETSSSIMMASLTNEKNAVAKLKFNKILLPIRGRLFNEHGEARRAVMLDVEDSSDNSFPRGLTGLCNLGNTCYMNAALQALSNCPPLSEFFRSISSLAPFASHCISQTFEPSLSRAFRLLLQAIWSSSRSGCTTPQLLLTQVRVNCPQFRGWGQQDSQEFIRCFLDMLHRELRQPVYSWERRNETSVEGMNLVDDSPFLSFQPLPAVLLVPSGSKRVAVAIRRNSSSSSSSRCSNSLDRYETADSGWSSDGDTCATGTSGVLSSINNRKRCRSVSPGALERLNVRDSAVLVSNRSTRKSRVFFKDSTEVPMRYRSIVNDVFDGQLRSTVKCLTCHHVSETYETFQDLSLCIPTKEQLERLASVSRANSDELGNHQTCSTTESMSSNRGWLWWIGAGWLRSFYGYLFTASISLSDAFNAFFSPDDLRDDNMYSCEKCSKLRNGLKVCKITRLPEILCIHLKRFRHDSSYSTKVATNVSFPLYDLDLSQFVSSKTTGPCDSALYDLCAFVTHHGNSAESGHYLAYCKNEVDNNWYEFDDTVVTKLEPADVLTKEAYVLFYQKKGTQRMEKVKNTVQRLFEDELSQNRKKNCLSKYYISREWLQRLSAFSHPGPITNYDFLCRHSQILPRKASELSEHYAVIDSPTWDYLINEFGGGPPCTELHYCTQCQSEHQWLQHKREHEIKTFKVVENRTREAAAAFPALTYGFYLPSNAISKSWLLKWRAFVDGEELVPPGPIDNSSLLVRSPTDSLTYFRRSASYVELPRELWLFFFSIYGGGPEVFCTFEPHPTEEEVAELVAAIEPKMKEALELLKAHDRAKSCASLNGLRMGIRGDVENTDFGKETIPHHLPALEMDYEALVL